MNILITGMCGLIGSHLGRLLHKKHKIIGIDDLSSGYMSNISDYASKTEGLIENSVQNVLERDCWYEKQYDVFIHLAGSLGVKNVVQDPFGAIDNNLDSTKAALSLAKKLNCKKFVFTSTSEVYGSGQNSRFAESDDFRVPPPHFPRATYGVSKILDEFIVDKFCKDNNIDFTILRLFNVVGPCQRATGGFVLPNFIDAALQNKPLRIFDNGQSVRTFTSVFDCVKVIETMINPKTRLYYNIYNVGSNNTTTIDNLANEVIKLTYSESTKEYVDSKKIYGSDFYDVEVRIPNLTRLTEIVDISKFQTLTQIITSTIPARAGV